LTDRQRLPGGLDGLGAVTADVPGAVGEGVLGVGTGSVEAEVEGLGAEAELFGVEDRRVAEPMLDWQLASAKMTDPRPRHNRKARGKFGPTPCDLRSGRTCKCDRRDSAHNQWHAR
jgi:hypothetical protein